MVIKQAATILQRYIFNDITDTPGEVRILESASSHRSYLVEVDDHEFHTRSQAFMSPVLADLVDISVAVNAVDRLANKSKKNRYEFIVTLPLRQPDIFSQTHIKDKLEHILEWYTGDKWVFEFCLRAGLPRHAEHVAVLPFREIEHVEVALWSGGLDALAGLVQRSFAQTSARFVLLGSGSNDYVFHKQANLFANLPVNLKNRTRLIQVPIRLKSLDTEVPENQRTRSRGFLFLLMGTVCALLQGSRELYVYENGVGAINLPFHAAEVGLDHARSVHPLSLIYLSEWITEVTGQQFTIQNPFLLSTKAEVCRTLFENGLDALAFETITCDRRHRNAEAQQCGWCSSCILRRQAFTVLGSNDRTKYVHNSFWNTQKLGPKHKNNHLPAMLFQVKTLEKLFLSDNPWPYLSSYYETLAFDVVDQLVNFYEYPIAQLEQSIVDLYKHYLQEWQSIPQFALTSLV